MTITISREEARRLLTLYHFRPSDLAGVFARLGTVQYDPLNPAGRNPDLVLQARVPGYRIDDWQRLAYEERQVYDAWDKQACIVPVSDWPLRALIREHHRPYHDRAILDGDAAAAAEIMATIEKRGPISSLEFEERGSAGDKNSWYGVTRVKRILRAFWACGLIVTHHRRSGRHYYDLPRRVIPPQYFNAPELLDREAYLRWIVAQRHRATGLLRKNAEPAIWSACGSAQERNQAVAQLVEEGTLTPVLVGEKKWLYYAYTEALRLLDEPPLEPRVRFLAPLDNFIWDRKGIQQLFDFDYIWEVYKPEAQRKWGYYVLPVLYGERFIARLDSRLVDGAWTILRWWWEPDVRPDAELLTALHTAIGDFLRYLSTDSLRLGEGVERAIAPSFVR